VEAFIARQEPWFAAALDMPKERLLPTFLRSFGLDPPDVEPSEKDLADAMRTAHEPPPWKAEVPLDRLAQASLPTLVVSGAWDLAPPEAREIAGAAFRVVCDEIADRLNAERTVFPGEMHEPQLAGKPFNDRLREFLRHATTDTET
jgi:pimeloyl-ACP methyl ester carboxylesterase